MTTLIAVSKQRARSKERTKMSSSVKERCQECGSPAIAKGLCRKHYDQSRQIPRIAISKSIQEDFERLQEIMGWDAPMTANYLMACGIKFLRMRGKIAQEWDLKVET